ncbi:MAG: hypothetical protein ACR2M9_04910 [Cyanophyceae cyanobacterium]
MSDPEWFEFAKNYITNNVTLPKWAFERWMMRLRFFVPLILIIVPVCLGVFIWAFYCLVQLGIFPQELPAEGQPKKEGEYHRSIKSPNQLESAKAGESSNASNSKGIFFTIIDAVTGKYDAEEPSEAIPSQTKPEATLWVMKPNGEVGGPFTRQYLSELKAAGKLPKGLKASESESGPWQNLPSG